MDTDVLRWFQQVADGTTVTEVADVYMVSQPAVSRALARLDDEVGTALLHKQGRQLQLTLAGSVFKQHVDSFMHSLDDALAAVNELADPETGTVAVAFQMSLGTWLVPHMIEGFGRRHPHVRFRLSQSHDALGTALLATGRIDLEFTARRPQHPDVRWEHLFAQPLRLVVPPGHRLVGAAEVSLAEVADEPFIMPRPSWELRTITETLCAAAGFVPLVAFEGDDLSVVHGFVAAGLGNAIVPAAGRKEPLGDAAAERLIKLSDPGAFRDVGLAWSQRRHHLPSADLFREYVLDA